MELILRSEQSRSELKKAIDNKTEALRDIRRRGWKPVYVERGVKRTPAEAEAKDSRIAAALLAGRPVCNRFGFVKKNAKKIMVLRVYTDGEVRVKLVPKSESGLVHSESWSEKDD